MTMRFCSAVLIAGAVALLDGCGLSRPPLVRTSYLLTATREPPPAATPKPVAVKLRPLRAAPLFERKEFVYRFDSERVVSDFYNEFADAPESMATAALTGWLRSARLFATVVEPGVPVDAPYALDGSIVTLYGDLRNPAKPAAIMAIQFYLLRSANRNGPELVFERMLQSRVDVPAATPEAIARGFSQALAEILAQLERELAALEYRP